MSAYFVSGTGTNIGKTFVAAGLVHYWRERGLRVGALKPVVSGFTSATAHSSDPGILLDALARPATAATLDAISPWRFAPALSPDMAAARERRSIDFDAVVAFCRKEIASAQGPLLIEGVGGVMVPLDATHTVLDWMSALRLPVILVAGSYLGTISHTLSALDVLARVRLTVGAVVINDTGDSVVPLTETQGSIARFAPNVPFALLPRARDWRDARTHFAKLASLL